MNYDKRMQILYCEPTLRRAPTFLNDGIDFQQNLTSQEPDTP